MKKDEFMRVLREKLRYMEKEEYQEALNYYEEYLEEAGEENEEKVIKKLGGPDRVAAQIRADIAASRIENSENKNYDQPRRSYYTDRSNTRNNANAILYILIGIFALPIALPIAIGLFAALFCIAVAVFSVIFGIVITIIMGGVFGFISFGIGIYMLFNSFYTGVVFIGMGLIGIGTFTLCLMPTIFIIRKTLKAFAIALKNLFYKIRGKISREKKH